MATDDQNEWLLRVLGIDVAAPFDAVVLQERLTAIVTDLKLYRAPRLGAEVKEAAAALKARRGDTEALIGALEDKVAQIAAEFRRAEVRAETGKGGMGKAGVVAFAKMRLRWENARTSFADATANITDGFRAMLETEEFQDDPRSHDSDTLSLIDALAARLPRLDEIAGTINDALDSSGDTPDQRAKNITAATNAIWAYENKLGAFDELRAFESTAAGAFPTISLIESSLAELKAALASAQSAAGSNVDAERNAA